jgi:Ser-tRNA(Ala) deacylase AlaX
VRVIEFGDASCPCGGTHVQNVGEIEQLQVMKVQKKGKNVRVQYKVL